MFSFLFFTLSNGSQSAETQGWSVERGRRQGARESRFIFSLTDSANIHFCSVYTKNDIWLRRYSIYLRVFQSILNLKTKDKFHISNSLCIILFIIYTLHTNWQTNDYDVAEI